MSPWLDIKVMGATAVALLTDREIPLSWLVKLEEPILPLDAALSPSAPSI